MGALCSCCGGSSSSSGGETYSSFRAQSAAPTTADLEARRQAAEAAEARQAKFDASPGGRAARKAVDNVKKEREADAAARQNKDTVQDWLS